MSAHVQNTKAALRRQMRAELKILTLEHRAAASVQACLLLEKQAVWKQARSILFYAPMPGELDIWRLVEESVAVGKLVALPQYQRAENRYVACRIERLPHDLKPGLHGIREPADHCALVPLNRLDLVLAPGVAFDLRGGRLGRGKGFYDQLLAHVRGTKVGVAFDEQIVGEIPVEPHDVYLNCILTPTRWIEPKPRAVLE